MARLAFAVGALAAAVALAPAAHAASLVIDVTGLRSDDGLLHYAVYDDATAFPTRRGRVAKGELPIRDRNVVIRLDGLKPGKYAIAVFHDENRNDAFDQGIFGIPLEDYAFSNNASGFFSAPSFDAASFDVGEPERRIVIRMDW